MFHFSFEVVQLHGKSVASIDVLNDLFQIETLDCKSIDNFVIVQQIQEPFVYVEILHEATETILWDDESTSAMAESL